MNRPVTSRDTVGAKSKGARGRKTARLEARLSPYVLKVVKYAAEMQGRSISDFVVAAAEAAAEEAIERSRRFELTLKDQRTLADALANPPKPGAAWRKARAAHNRLIKGSHVE